MWRQCGPKGRFASQAGQDAMMWEGARFHHTTQKDNLKLRNSLFLEFSI